MKMTNQTLDDAVLSDLDALAKIVATQRGNLGEQTHTCSLAYDIIQRYSTEKKFEDSYIKYFNKILEEYLDKS